VGWLRRTWRCDGRLDSGRGGGRRLRLGVVVGEFPDHVDGVVELHTSGVAHGGVEGAENEFGALELDGAANEVVDDLHEGGLDGFLVFKDGEGMDARLGNFDAIDEALVEIAELISTESGGATLDSGDFDMTADSYWHMDTCYFFIVCS